MLLVATFFIGSRVQAADKPVAYARALTDAVGYLETGQHALARNELARALSVDRNEPAGLLALATLYLHTGDGPRAERLLRSIEPWLAEKQAFQEGMALAKLLQKDVNGALPYAAASPTLWHYLRLVQGEASDIARELADVGPGEPDALKLEVAGLAALRGGAPERGATLLRALLARPEWRSCAESKAVVLPALPQRLVEATAGTINPIALPEPSPKVPPLAGRVPLTPGNLPGGTAMVVYSVVGAFTSTTNNPPFVGEWNTGRYPNGIYNLQVCAYDGDGRVLTQKSVYVRVANAEAPLSVRLTDEQRDGLEHRLAALLAPQPSRKAAHFALAEYAIQKGDSAEALARIESVVAIDPSYRGAFQSLQRYNERYVGLGNGYWKGKTAEKLVALTFDDGPNPLPYRTPALLDMLRNLGIKGTFFIVGYRAEAAPDLIRRIDAEGHELANHSYTHPNLTYLSANDVRKELCRTSVVVRDLTGKRPRFYRPPGGNYNGAIAEAASALGMNGAYWTVDAYKLEKAPFTSAQLAQFVLSRVRPGAIVLLHNAFDNTIEALPTLVKGLREQGYEIVTMSELVRRSQPATPSAKKKP